MPPKKRQRTQQMQESSLSSSLVGSTTNPLQNIRQLSEFIERIIVESESERTNPAEADAEAEELITNLNETIKNARERAQANRAIMQKKAQKEEISEMGLEEEYSTDFQILDFLNRFKSVINGTRVLTHGQRARLFRALLRSVDEIITEEQGLTTQGTTSEFGQSIVIDRTDHLDRLRQIWSIVITQFGILVQDFKTSAPDMARQVGVQGSALLGASLLAYSYLPDIMRLGAQSVPYIGSLFRLTEIVRPYSLPMQTSVAAVTMIYYFLRNTGIDTTEVVREIGSFTRECAEVAATATCNFITSHTPNILNYIGEGWNNMLRPQDLESMTMSSQSSISENSLITQTTIISIESLLNNTNVQVNMTNPPHIEAANIDVISEFPSVPQDILIEGSQGLSDMSSQSQNLAGNIHERYLLGSQSESQSLLGGKKHRKHMYRYKSMKSKSIKSNKTKKVRKHNKGKKLQLKTNKMRKNKKTMKK
jgi:hypothetical protein